MNQTPTILRGVVHGNIIEFERDLGVPDGQEVSVIVQAVSGIAAPDLPPLLTEARRRWREAWEEVEDLPPGEGLRLAAGACAEDADEIDEFVKWTYEQRKQERRPLES